MLPTFLNFTHFTQICHIHTYPDRSTGVAAIDFQEASSREKR